MPQKWWDIYKPCQEPLETRGRGEWWANMEEVFHYYGCILICCQLSSLPLSAVTKHTESTNDRKQIV